MGEEDDKGKKSVVKVKTEPESVIKLEVEPTSSGRAGSNDTIRPNDSQNSEVTHALMSTKRGKSSVETLAKKIEERRAKRIPIPFGIRKQFLSTCRDIAIGEGYRNKMSVTALHRLRDDYKKKAENQPVKWGKVSKFAGHLLGFWNYDVVMLELLDAACESSADTDSSWFFFRDFSFYSTALTQRFSLFRSPATAATAYLLMYYMGSAILFCPIMKDENVCPNQGSYEGWLTSVYFASVTMSTVGYGDVSLYDPEERWRTFIGLVYMVTSMVVAYTVFSTAADAALSAVQLNSNNPTILFRPLVKKIDESDMLLHERVRNLAILRATDLFIWFLILNLIGIFVARAFIRNSDVDDQQWSWMTTFYWAVQTTTTIGYGDVDMPFDMRWFQIFFTTFGTAFVGALFGAFAGLKEEIGSQRRFYAWKRRQISKRMIDEMQGDDADEYVDQYEFMVGSLLMLNKISRSDVEMIMDKYRQLAGENGIISMEDLNKVAEMRVEDGQTVSTGAEDSEIALEIDCPQSRF